MFVLDYLNRNDGVKRFNVRNYYLPKGIIKNYNVTINGKNFYYQAIDFDIKRNKEIRKLTTGQGEYYTTGCFDIFIITTGYEYIKNHYKLIQLIWAEKNN